MLENINCIILEGLCNVILSCLKVYYYTQRITDLFYVYGNKKEGEKGKKLIEEL